MSFHVDFHFNGGNFLIVGASSGIERQITEEIVEKGGYCSGCR